MSKCRWKPNIGTKKRSLTNHTSLTNCLHYLLSVLGVHIFSEKKNVNYNVMFICELDLKVMLDTITLFSNFLHIFGRFHLFTKAYNVSWNKHIFYEIFSCLVLLVASTDLAFLFLLFFSKKLLNCNYFWPLAFLWISNIQTAHLPFVLCSLWCLLFLMSKMCTLRFKRTSFFQSQRFVLTFYMNGKSILVVSLPDLQISVRSFSRIKKSIHSLQSSEYLIFWVFSAVRIWSNFWRASQSCLRTTGLLIRHLVLQWRYSHL